jgi:hypothetical protein
VGTGKQCGLSQSRSRWARSLPAGVLLA